MSRSRQSFCEILKCMGSISARCSEANWGFRHLADQERLVKTFNLWLRKDRGIEFWKKNGKERRARRVPLKFCWWIHVLWNKLLFMVLPELAGSWARSPCPGRRANPPHGRANAPHGFPRQRCASLRSAAMASSRGLRADTPCCLLACFLGCCKVVLSNWGLPF